MSVKLALCYEDSVRMFENGLLRMIFGSKREEVTGDCRKLRNEELHDWYSSSIIIRVSKSRRMGWLGHVVRTGEKCIQGFGG